MDVLSYINQYGYIANVDRILDSQEYKALSLEEKKVVLMKIMDTNYQNSIDNNRNIVPVNYSYAELKHDNEEESVHQEKNNFSINISALLHCKTIDEMIELRLLPKKDSIEHNREIKKILFAVRRELESYYDIRLEDNEGTFDNDIEQLENLFELLVDYNTYEIEEIEIPKTDDFCVFYLPEGLDFTDPLNLSPIIKDMRKNKQQQTLINMINSIKTQEFKGLKRFSNELSEFYELRSNQQRVVFHFLTPNVVIICSLFTKKVDSDKKYRHELITRMNKYRRMKKELKKHLETDEFLNAQIEIDNIIKSFDSGDKVLVKTGDYNE